MCSNGVNEKKVIYVNITITFFGVEEEKEKDDDDHSV